ncbi:hypothetical protein TNCV_2916721 [Trichonephila clavipes]|nr:hypothetical protein TNCV_2916721 [Trichonephila clavipes]
MLSSSTQAELLHSTSSKAAAPQISTNTRYLLLALPNNEMSNKSPFAVHKALIGIGGEPATPGIYLLQLKPPGKFDRTFRTLCPELPQSAYLHCSSSPYIPNLLR